MARLGDIGKIITGNTPKTSETLNYSSNDICFIKPSDILDGEITVINDSEFYISNHARDKARILPPKCVLVTCIGIIGKVAINNVECAFNQQINAIVPDQSKCLTEYLAYAIQNKQKEMQDIANAPVVPILNKTQFSEIEIELPSVEEQTEVVAKIRAVDGLIFLRKQQLSKLDEFLKSRFVELFGDPKLNDKGWKCGILSDYFEVKGGKRIPKGMGYSDIKTNHPYLRATDMKNETILEDDIRYISEEVFQHIKRYTVNGGDIYLTNVGVNLGMAGVIPQKFDGASLTENAVKLVPKTERVIDGLFLAHYINSPGIQDYINERKMAVGVPKLAIFRIETMPLLIPPMEVQQDFIAFAEQIDKSKFEIQKSLEKLETLKNSLMQKYFG